MPRNILISLTLLLLAGCSGLDRVGFEPRVVESQIAAAAPVVDADEPRLDERVFVAADGAELPLRVWLPEGRPDAVILALHGFNDYSNAFAMPAPGWAAEGIATYAYDQRGFGAAPGRGRWPGARAMADDVAVASRLLRARHPGVPLYLLGESMGGALAITAMTGTAGTARPDVDALVLVAPAVWGRQTMSLIQRAGLFLARLMPSVHLSGRSLPVTIHPSDNIPMLRAYSADPMVIKETRADTLNGLVDLMSLALDSAPLLEIPTLVLYGDHDDIVPRGPIIRMVDRLPESAKGRQRVAFYPNGYHMLLRDLQSMMVVRDVTAWITDRNALLPSGADLAAGPLSIGRIPAFAGTTQRPS